MPWSSNAYIRRCATTSMQVGLRRSATCSECLIIPPIIYPFQTSTANQPCMCLELPNLQWRWHQVCVACRTLLQIKRHNYDTESAGSIPTLNLGHRSFNRRCRCHVWGKQKGQSGSRSWLWSRGRFNRFYLFHDHRGVGQIKPSSANSRFEYKIICVLFYCEVRIKGLPRTK
jgi:hypothetical protein